MTCSNSGPYVLAQMGVFFYSYAGVGATASMVVGTLAKEDFLGCTFRFMWCFAVDIRLKP